MPVVDALLTASALRTYAMDGLVIPSGRVRPTSPQDSFTRHVRHGRLAATSWNASTTQELLS